MRTRNDGGVLMGALAVIGLLVLGMVLAIFVGAAFQSPPKRMTNTAILDALTVDAKKRISEELRAPSTTKWGEVHSSWSTDDLVTLVVEYDSQNGFGAMLHGAGVLEYQINKGERTEMNLVSIDVGFRKPRELR